MILTDEQKRMHQGEYGPGVQKAMAFLIEYGEAFDGQRMARVDSVHSLIDPEEWASRLLEGVEKVRVNVATLHSLVATETKWARPLGISEEKAAQLPARVLPMLERYTKIGFTETMTCAPYLVGDVPPMGAVFSSIGSSGIIINNSLFGARGNRDSGVAMTCSAITGVTPDMLLLRPEERYGEVLVRLRGLAVENFSTADYGALGYYIGKAAGTRNVVIDGIPGRPSFEKLKFLLSPQPVSGAVSLCHIVGVTPEAPTLEEALGHRKPVEEITVGKREMQEVYDALNTARGNEVDVVYFGCPHCTLTEIQEIAKLVASKKKAKRVRLWVSTNESMYVIAKRMGLVDIIEGAGGLVVTDLCMMVFPFAFLEAPVKNVASNSARAVHYQRTGGLAIGGAIAVGTFYGSTEQCIDAAMTGRWGG